MRNRVWILFAGLFLSCGLTSKVLAIPQFQKEFYRVYNIDKKAEQPSDFVKVVLEAKCHLCHQGKKRKNHNPYGDELAKLLDKKKDKKNPEKIVQALEKVAKLPTNPKDKKSPTYGALIKAGKLPGGSLEEAKKEPKEDAEKEGSEKKEESDKT
ncbi:MAG: hypothetical protein MI725_16350 [Pirellulales bacterium]|nr:hypothetical protein [Pirellulales bacterium]